MWYTLRMDTPLDSKWYMDWILKAVEPNRDYLMVAEEVSPKGKEHIHTIMYISNETQELLRNKLGNYKSKLKKEYPIYFDKVYGNSKKIQVFSLTRVRNFNTCKRYMTKGEKCVYYPSHKEWCEKYTEVMENSKAVAKQETFEKIDNWMQSNKEFIEQLYLDEHCDTWLNGESAMDFRPALDFIRSGCIKIFAKLFTDLGHMEKMRKVFYEVLLKHKYISTEYYCSVIYRVN